METLSPLRPPTTINVNNDNMDEDRHPHHHDDSGPTSNAVLREVEAQKTSSWNKENLDMETQDIESVIHSFNAELENLSRSFDLLASAQASYSRAPSIPEQRAAAPSDSQSRRPVSAPYSSTSQYLHTKTSSRTSSYLNDPPPSADMTSPLRFSAASTPARGSNSSARRNHSHYDANSTSCQPLDPSPPRPVETPALDRLGVGYAGRTPTTTTTSGRNYNIRTPRAGSANKVDWVASQSINWEATCDKMRLILEEHEKTIAELKSENDDLRRQLLQYRRPHDQGHRDGPQPFSSSDGRFLNRGGTSPGGAGEFAPATGRHTYSEDGSYRRPPSSSFSTLRINGHLSTPPRDDFLERQADLDPPRRIDVIPEEYAEFTPGTRFVAELARLMQFEIGHHAPLSVIIDKHWDRLKYTMREDA